MSKHLEREIDHLKRKILALSAVVEESVSKAVTSIATRDADLASSVIDGDQAIDDAEVDVEEECLKILALHAPATDDLRFIVACMKLNNDLERIGDLAVNIAEKTAEIAAREPQPAPFDVEAMARQVRQMLAEALDALVNLDCKVAREVCAADDQADETNRENYRRVEAAIRAKPDDVSYLIQYLSVSRYLERIADHATNIAEDVIYMSEGEIVRHGGLDRRL